MGKTLADLDVGSKVKFGKYQVASEEPWDIVWTIVAKNHQCEPAYPENSVTLLASEILDLRCFDAKEPNSSNESRVGQGNNRYAVSNMNNWLNSKASAGNWYSAQHDTDQAPDSSSYVSAGTEHASRPGFLYLFSDGEYKAILTTTIRTVKPNTDGEGYEDISAKVFLPSKTEIGLGAQNNINEGGVLAYCKNSFVRIGYLTQQCYDNTASTSKPSSKSAEWQWWLRTPHFSSASSALYVGTDGNFSYNSARQGYFGVRPALNLSGATKVSETTDSDGAYVVSKIYSTLGEWAKDTCDAIRSKDGTSEPIAHGDIPERIKAIPTGSDTSGITATAGDVSENVKFLSKDGVLTQGTMPEIAGEEVTLTKDSPETTIKAGHHDGTGKVKADYSGLADVSGVTAGASDVLSGKTFVDSSGAVTDGSMVNQGAWTSTRTSNGYTYIPAGYHNGSGYVRANVSSSTTYGTLGTPTISVNSSTGVITANSTVSSSGYISSSSTKSGTLSQTTQAAQTITPGTSNKTISSGVFLTGTQTIKGDKNLVASNIKSGVSIFGVSGTYGGSSGYKVVTSTVTTTSISSGEPAIQLPSGVSNIENVFLFDNSNILTIGATVMLSAMIAFSNNDIAAIRVVKSDGDSSTGTAGIVYVSGYLILEDDAYNYASKYAVTVIGT